MLGEYTIREAKPGDMDEIIGLSYEHAAFERAEIPAHVDWQVLADHIFHHKDVYCLVVEDQDQVVGFATLMKQFSTWDAAYYLYLDCLYLKSIARGKGLGQVMMQKVAALAKSHECGLMQWQTPVFNEPAIRFYERLGAASQDKKRFFWKL
ncbi:GNAT family N-acetyltransferase [Fulvivirga ulvae]|uniref:GNAT family N-acetyltransferase n=1 Tax=Fulvivirga ulvae TaxID=2904245 RepID=UPI001F2F244C|nr:GNAT family N-acetyltransferase [Fulvivirga ulvae]UII32120.1 GNAT family N-acetyltransferase [Fulvivirga ulvae]